LHPAVQFYDYGPVIGFWGEDYSKIIPRSQKKTRALGTGSVWTSQAELLNPRCTNTEPGTVATGW